MENKEEEIHDVIPRIICIILIILIVFKLGLLILGYVYADEVKCNYLWCTFSKTLRSQECFVNGEKVDCSELNDFNSSNFSSNFKGTSYWPFEFPD